MQLTLFGAVCYSGFPVAVRLLPPSSRGPGHLPFTEVTGVRIPLGVDLFPDRPDYKNTARSLFAVMVLAGITDKCKRFPLCRLLALPVRGEVPGDDVV